MRVWGAVEDRLVEVRAEACLDGLRIVGLPDGRCRTATDRVGAAIANSRVGPEVPSVKVTVEPALTAEPTNDLDLPLALAALLVDAKDEAGWIFARGRLGLDGRIYSQDLSQAVWLQEALASCRSHLLESNVCSESSHE